MDKLIRLVAVDMDGTLLRSDKTVDPQTIADIRAATECGIRVVYCTGRGSAEMQEVFRLLPMIRYAICNSGAVRSDDASRQGLYASRPDTHGR